jgi:hypothetical protein
MKIIQNNDGSGTIVFNEQEKKLIAEKSEFFLPVKFLKDFSNVLIKLAADVHSRLPDDLRNKQTKFDKDTGMPE